MSRPPNILLIVADDMGYGDFGRFGDGGPRTPALDGLIDEGTCLTQHYSGSPVCAPARAALLTGRYPHRTGAITPQEVMGLDRIHPREVTLADSLSHGGYTTGLIGKWHNGALDDRFHPNRRGFDEFVGFRGGWMDYWDWWIERQGAHVRADGRYLTDVFTDEALSFLRRHRCEPFLLNLCYNAPHSPLQAPADVVQSYLDRGIATGAAITYAMNEVMDRGITRLLTELDDLGLAQNTLVMFTSDNGPAMRLRADQVPAGMGVDTSRGNAGFRGAKGSVYEGGIRVPMVMRWPAGLTSGQTVDDLVHFTDWLPTLLGITDTQRLTGMPLDGGDVLPLLRGESPADAPRRFWQWNAYSPVGTSNAAMRDGPWKLVRPQLDLRPATAAARALMARYVEQDIAYKRDPCGVTLMTDAEPERIIGEPPPPELYHIRDDPGEVEDLAAAYPERASHMLTELESWFEQVEAERRVIAAQNVAS
jgi:arylsulfatase A-like enzyme